MTAMPSEGGSYSMGITELLALDDLSTLAGKFVKFFFSPRVRNNHLEGMSPKTRFVLNSDGVYVPTDETTMQMVTIYAHMQKLAALDEELGAGGVNKWPRDVGIAVRVAGSTRNNAFYEGKTDSILVVPYTGKELPLAVNGGVLAHEHFHSLFYKLVIKDAATNVHGKEIADTFGEDFGQISDVEASRIQPVGPTLSSSEMNYFYHVAITRGLNEGLADFWGWMYTGDPDFIVHSLPGETGRTLKVSRNQTFLSSDVSIRGELNRRYNERSGDKNFDFTNQISGYVYVLGTQFSRAIKVYTEVYAKARAVEPLQARKDVAKVIIKMLPSLREELSQSETKIFTGQTFVESFAKNTQLATQEECQYLANLINDSRNGGSRNVTECQENQGQWTFHEKRIEIGPRVDPDIKGLTQ
ncbi:hypothetical protein AZI86_03600 [Bdellovibrio bacteriovorus]|uniref:Uncharacterized protein n=2 Tax=Bdellovibrio bacteriovorus TaxID=959 RepID=A0A150WPD4_BDEBC|nr:hypothetical protein AZI86_03600 [Bdellovibrio bacteriovorus]